MPEEITAKIVIEEGGSRGSSAGNSNASKKRDKVQEKISKGMGTLDKYFGGGQGAKLAKGMGGLAALFGTGVASFAAIIGGAVSGAIAGANIGDAAREATDSFVKGATSTLTDDEKESREDLDQSLKDGKVTTDELSEGIKDVTKDYDNLGESVKDIIVEGDMSAEAFGTAGGAALDFASTIIRAIKIVNSKVDDSSSSSSSSTSSVFKSSSVASNFTSVPSPIPASNLPSAVEADLSSGINALPAFRAISMSIGSASTSIFTKESE